MRVADQGDLLLVLPAQIGNVAHRHRDEKPASCDADCQREHGPEEETSIAADDAACHRPDEDVYGSGKQLLASLGRGR